VVFSSNNVVVCSSFNAVVCCRNNVVVVGLFLALKEKFQRMLLLPQRLRLQSGVSGGKMCHARKLGQQPAKEPAKAHLNCSGDLGNWTREEKLARKKVQQFCKSTL